jgi:phenylacetate-coenzyme A ligase PaaK-like adenylate-forming protein
VDVRGVVEEHVWHHVKEAPFTPPIPAAIDRVVAIPPLNSWKHKPEEWFWRAFRRITSSSWLVMMFRMSLRLSESTITRASNVLAIAAYHQALRVPAFQQHLLFHCMINPRFFHEIPATDKDGYIKPAIGVNEASLYLDGILTLTKTKRDTSTGTSGKSTSWYRGPCEQRAVEKMTSFAAKVVVGNKPYTCINGFAMGPWATGITSTLALNRDGAASVAVVGPNIPELFEAMKEICRLRGRDHPIVMAMYPPHARAVVDLANKHRFPMHEYNLICAVGGESMSEDLRELIVVSGKRATNRTGFRACFSNYGASDTDIAVGFESDFEIEVRKLCHLPQYKALAVELFGANQFIPMIFHYDPLNYKIEVDAEGNVLYTCVRLDRISPRIRYNLGDHGRIMSCSDMMLVLKKHGISLTNRPRTNLPLLFIWGRRGASISFRGAKVAPENLGESIRRLDGTGPWAGLNAQLSHYGFYQHEAKGVRYTDILLEFSEPAPMLLSDLENLWHMLLETLALVNSDLPAQFASCPPDEKMGLIVFSSGASPMSVQQQRYSMRKKQYVFNEGDEFVPSHTTLLSQSAFSFSGKRDS